MEQQPGRPEEQPREETSPEGDAQPGAEHAGAQPPNDEYKPELIQGGLFPHEIPTEHWKADFGDSRQVYQGSRLPVWLLAGWATFIIWALVYLYFGLTKF
ncbi:MAG: hypothetical protein ETSY1_33300 [Candidatus Entotheonella factor]|uniref:Uncharacterized protein n=1 Tax=Entotheonella factor TaxID=1429438 RepID=W4LA89_ENTF1|nr:MAG: hypothetical protein ETSY1_33300 [Candidatus Entotheonella factor]